MRQWIWYPKCNTSGVDMVLLICHFKMVWSELLDVGKALLHQRKSSKLLFTPLVVRLLSSSPVASLADPSVRLQPWEDPRSALRRWAQDLAPRLQPQTQRRGSSSSSNSSSCSMHTSASGGSRPTVKCGNVTCPTAAPWRMCWTTWLIARLANPARVSFFFYLTVVLSCLDDNVNTLSTNSPLKFFLLLFPQVFSFSFSSSSGWVSVFSPLFSIWM